MIYCCIIVSIGQRTQVTGYHLAGAAVVVSTALLLLLLIRSCSLMSHTRWHYNEQRMNSIIGISVKSRFG